MYGLLLEAIYDALKERYGEDALNTIREVAGIDHHSFITNEYYSEQVIPKIAGAVCEVTMVPFHESMTYFGFHFVDFVGKYGYDVILRVLGRNMRDFLSGLDNLHEYLRLSYPKMRAPSFFCENETAEGLTLHYRSKRTGFSYYVMGQIRQVGLVFYNTEVEIEIIDEEIVNGLSHVTMQLHFDNKGFVEVSEKRANKCAEQYLVPPEVFFKAFPFHVVYGRNMAIRSYGSGLRELLPGLMGTRVDHSFEMTKPPLDFSFEHVLSHTNNIFELTSVSNVAKRRQKKNILKMFDEEDEEDMSQRLGLRGQMRYMAAWDAFIFLANPILENMERMYELGLYINDLSMHDVSRDLVMVGTEQSKELKSALNQQRQKSKKLEEMMRLLDMEIKRTDSLLYQMIPKEVADRLRCGEPAVNTCQTFKAVSVLFSKVDRFTDITSKIEPMQCVNLLNSMYTRFDTLTEKHKVYKVETVGDSYMVVSGAPTETRYHSVHICDMALDMMEAIQGVDDASNIGPGGHVKVRIGVHSGMVVAGIVGLRMPRYCLFGDCVNTASRMESNGEPMKIHVSEVIVGAISEYPYVTEERGTIDVKGKGNMKTYWLMKRTAATSSFLPQSTSQLLSGINPSSRRGSSHSDLSRARSAGYTPVTFDAVSKSHLSIKSLMAAAYSEEDAQAAAGGAAHATGTGTATSINGIHDGPDVINEVATARAAGSGCHGSNTCQVM